MLCCAMTFMQDPLLKAPQWVKDIKKLFESKMQTAPPSLIVEEFFGIQTRAQEFQNGQQSAQTSQVLWHSFEIMHHQQKSQVENTIC